MNTKQIMGIIQDAFFAHISITEEHKNYQTLGIYGWDDFMKECSAKIDSLPDYTELIKAYEDYIKFLEEELEELAPRAANRGWSSRYENEELLLERISKAKEKVG